MSGLMLLDANVVLRVLLEDDRHPKYQECRALLESPSIIKNYVMPEIIYQFLAYIRKENANKIAEMLGELDLFLKSPRSYTAGLRLESGWRKRAYKTFAAEMSLLRRRYPNVCVEQEELYDKSLEIAEQTGFDWVDCLMIAEHNLFDRPIASVDRNVADGLKISPYCSKEAHQQ